jgi:tetratricopeptide (TPR) repeat protein
LRLPPDASAALAHLEGRGATAQRWAAHLVEHKLRDLPDATARWHQLMRGRAATARADGSPPTPVDFVLDHLAGCHRRAGEPLRLAALYDAMAAASEPRSAAVWHCASAALALARGAREVARASFERAAEAAPRDPISRIALLRLHVERADWAAAARTLEEVLPRLNVPAVHRRYTRELAILFDEHLQRPVDAETSFEQLLTEDPLDAATLVALGALYERRNKPMLAIAVKRRAADLLPARSDKLRLLIEAAELCRQHNDPEEGRSALEQAQLLDPDDVDVQRLLAQLYGDLGEPERAVVAARKELARLVDPARRVEGQLRLASLLTNLAVESESVVAAYLEVLSVDPAHPEALAGIQAPARALGWWDALVRAFRSAPPTPSNLEVLAEALETMASWSELARIRQLQLEGAQAGEDGKPVDRTECVRRAVALAELYEGRLADADAAVRMLRHARSLAAPAEHPALRVRIEALLEKRGRWPELIELCRQDLAALATAPLEARLEILLRIARLHGDSMGDIEGAVGVCEEVLQLTAARSDTGVPHPRHDEVLVMLETLHHQRSDHPALAKVLRARASSTDRGARGAVLARLAQLHAADGDLDLAFSTFQAAMEATPADREIFTAYERLCYAELRWEDALRLYETAITHVEGGALRAYRLSDLYARKAQVQSQYLEDLDGAVESLIRLISLDGNPEAGASALEEICASRNDYKPLVAAFERRAQDTRDLNRRIDAYRRAALIAETHLDDAERVAELRKRLLALDPTDGPSSAALEAYYRERKDIFGLIELLQRQLDGARDPETTIAMLQRIAEVSEEEARDIDGAVSHYLKILELEPGHIESLEALGRIYESTERWVELIDVTRRQIRGVADRNSKALLYFRCGSVMEAKFGREEDAIRYYGAAIKVSAACMPAIHGLRDLYRRRQEWPRVIETLELEVKLWQEDKERADVLAQIGQIYSERLADNALAMHHFEEALSVDPDCTPANWALFEHYYATAAWDPAMALANSLTQRAMRDGDPSTRSEFFRKRGEVARRTGDPKTSADSFVVALEVRPTNLEALQALGQLVRAYPEVYDYESTYRELEKVYRRRDDAGPHLARVWIGLAMVAEHAGDLDAVAELSSAAIELAPTDLFVLSSVVDFHCDMRRWPAAVAAIEAFLPQATPADRTRALLRQAEIHGDGEIDALRAIAVLREAIRLEPGCHPAYYALAQQYYLHGRFAEARTAMDRAIDLATSPDAGAGAALLARYYYYKGRILEAAGDIRAGAAEYRRASEHDPAYAPPALLLSHRAAEAGERAAAEGVLIDAARAAISQGGNEAAVALQRGLARILLAAGERAAAIEAYRGMLAVIPDNASDRVALAEIYAVDDLPRAIAELRKVLELDIRHAPAYRLLASFYARTGETDRAGRVLAALDLLGFAEDADRSTAQRMRTVRLETPLVRSLDLDHRYHLLATRAMRDVLGELWAALAEEITSLFPAPTLGENLVPIAEHDPSLDADYRVVSRIFETQAEVFVGDRVPGMAAVVAFPRPTIVIDRSLCADGSPARRFLFGWALDAIRGGYAILLSLGVEQRRELTQLLRSLLASDRERSGVAVDLVRNASPRGAKVIERYAGRVRDLDVGGWIDGMQANAKRSGLLACDEFTASIWMIARLYGESLSSHLAMVALGAVLGGADLVRYYLSDDYQRLRDILTTPAPPA